MITLDNYGRVLKKRWWIVLLVFAVSLTTAIVLTSRAHKVYQSNTMLVVTPNSSVESVSETIRSLDSLDRRSVLATIAKIPTTRETFASSARRLDLKTRDLRGYRISASVLPNTNIIKINVEGRDPKRAAKLANAAAAVTKRKGRALYRIYKLSRLSEAVPRRHPIRPNPNRNILVASIVGLFLGIGMAFLFDYLRSPAHGPRGEPDKTA